MTKQDIDDAITQVYALRDMVARGYIKRTSPEQKAMLVLAKAYEDAQAAIQAAVLTERSACAKLCIDCDDLGVRPSQLSNLILDRGQK